MAPDASHETDPRRARIHALTNTSVAEPDPLLPVSRPLPGSVLAFPAGPPARTGSVVTAAMVQRQFPAAKVWRGNHTGSWWAMHPDVDRLVEASSAAELAFALRAALASARGVYGRWSLRAAA